MNKLLEILQQRFVFSFAKHLSKFSVLTCEQKYVEKMSFDQWFRKSPLLKSAVTSILTFASIICSGQNANVEGKVIDAKTNEPIPFANIYFNGTSIGTSSNSVGRFEINNVPVEYSELVASSVGFKTLSVSLKLLPNKTTLVEFKMTADVTMLSSIVIRDKRDKNWERLYESFCKSFIGQTSNSKLTRILNPEVLDLKFDPSSKVLIATADESLELENLALGYHISITLEKFEASDEHYLILTKSFFKTITPKNELEALRWQKNRIETFKGSQRHFFQSVIKSNFHQQGFTVRKNSINSHLDVNEFMQNERSQVYGFNLKRKDLVSDSTSDSFSVMQHGIYKIEYQRDIEDLNDEPILTSWIEVNDANLNIYSSGIVKPPASFWQLGYFERLRLADQLPSDYNYWDEEMKLFRVSNSGLGKITGSVHDEDGNPLKNVTVFINNGLVETKTNYWGQFELTKLPSGEYPIVFAYPGKQTEQKTISVDSSAVAEAMIILVEKKINPTGYQPVTKKMVSKILRAMHPKYSKLQLSLRNPEDVFFKRDGKATRLMTKGPLVFFSETLGYQWTYFFEESLIHRSELTEGGYFKLDTLKPKDNKEKNRWLSNRRNQYSGSLNQFLDCLVNGRLLENQIEVYQDLNPTESKTKRIDPVLYDSLIMLKNGKLWLTLKKKTRVQFRSTRTSRKIKQLNLEPGVSEIQISRSGVFDLSKLAVTASGLGKLPLTPIDQTIANRQSGRINTNSLIEKIYLHTDKPYYYPGDTIWFKGFLKYEQNSAPYLTSKVLYIDLLNNKSVLITTLRVPVQNGRANGDLFISESLPPADYTLRAYTRYSSAANYFFLKPIPVLSLNESIESNENDAGTIHPDLSVTLSGNQGVYRLGDTIRLNLNVLEDGKPAFAEGSVAVTDQLSVGALENKTIAVLNQDASEVYKSIISSSLLEQGLTHKIKILDGDPNEVYSVSALVHKNNEAISTTVTGNLASFTLNFTDSATIFLKCKDRRGKEFDVEFLSPEIPITLLPEPISYQTKKDFTPRSNLASAISNDSVTLLEEVMIKAKRIVTQKRKETPTEFVLGNVYNTMSDRELREIRRTADLVEELHSKIPRLNNPLNRFYLFVNGRAENPAILPIIKASEISRVDVYPRPTNVVAIYTESMIPYTGKNPNLFKLMGFSPSHKFYGGNSELNDFRSTIYWNPTVEIRSGVGRFEFPTSKSAGKYKVVIEGVTETGKVFRVVEYLKIVVRKE